MLGVGQKFPEFNLKANISDDSQTAFIDVNNTTYPNKWLVIFFWPKDFTFVCPTEIVDFGRMNTEFLNRNAQVLGASVDAESVHLDWRQQRSELSKTPFPMLSDLRRELSTTLGILDPVDNVAQRATYIVSPEGIIRFVMVNDMKVGRNPQEILRVLDALQTGQLCPSSWHKGDAVIDLSK